MLNIDEKNLAIFYDYVFHHIYNIKKKAMNFYIVEIVECKRL